ncbi:hypothetical protein DRE_00849 [Drechslerella stenobrocha 248]|uniref:Uncharacterized protein n=1 Tax=Drechslerella stenobrocha 248 TaxID=1043628 RepID=W7I8T1_9PEZI|nr:hypothetical protein DRE_00849 [Drechslerella stenobrocha 248]
MSSPKPTLREIKIFTPVGQMGQGFDEAIFWDTLGAGVDAIILDGGSTDSGPARLALGKTNVPKEGLVRDLELLTKGCHLYNVPVLVGSAGGDGENAFVDACAKIVAECIQKNGYRPMQVIKIYSEIPKEHILQKMRDGLVIPCGGAVPELLESDIESATRVVAQMGLEPFAKAMHENPRFDIIIGGRAYDPSPYAAFCLHKGFEDMGLNYAMGKLMECGAQCSIPKSRESLAVMRHDSFDFIPLDPRSRCTVTSVASHFLYEKTRPDILAGPGGKLYLDDTQFEQLDDRVVRVRGAKFVQEAEGQYTVKLEGARVIGYQSIFLGAIRDPILISQIDNWVEWIHAQVKERAPGFDYEVKIHKYGIDGVMGPLEPDNTVGKEVFIVGQVKAATQAQADQIASLTKFGFTHAPYTGQLATAGNFAWPISPCEISIGPLSEFCVYHIMQKADPIGLFPIIVEHVAGSNTFIQDGPLTAKTKPTLVFTPPRNTKKYPLEPEPAEGSCYLGDVASVLRSKNSGPYELTFDVMFNNKDIYERVKESGVLSQQTVAKMYNINDKDVLACLFWDPAMAFKATIKRPQVSGGFGETDTHGSQQHIPLLYAKLPWGRT